MMLTLYAVGSQKKASNAWKNKYFQNSVFDVFDQNGDLMLNQDELIREETTMQSLGSLKPSFEKNRT